MAILNPFDLLGDDESDDTSNLISLHKKLAEEKAEQEKIEKENARVKRILERKLRSVEDARKRDDEFMEANKSLKSAKAKLEEVQKALENAKTDVKRVTVVSPAADLTNRKQNPEEERARGKVIDCEKEVVKKESEVKKAEAKAQAAGGRALAARKEARVADEAFDSLDRVLIPAGFNAKWMGEVGSDSNEVADSNALQQEKANGYVNGNSNAGENESPLSRQSSGNYERPRSRNGSVNLEDGYQVPSRKHQSRSINGNEKSSDGGTGNAKTKETRDEAFTQETVDSTKAVEKVEKPVKEKPAEKAEKPVKEKPAEKAEKPVKPKAAEKSEKSKEDESPVSDANKDKELPDEKLMLLKEYEKIKEKRKQLLAAKTTEQRKIDVDKEFEAMQQLSVKKENDEVFFKVDSVKNGGKRKENKVKNLSLGTAQGSDKDGRKVKKSISAHELIAIKYTRPPRPQYREGDANQGRGRDNSQPSNGNQFKGRDDHPQSKVPAAPSNGNPSNGNQVRGRDDHPQTKGGYRAQTSSPTAPSNGNQGRGRDDRQSNGGYRANPAAPSNGNRDYPPQGARAQKSVHTPSLENSTDFPPLK